MTATPSRSREYIGPVTDTRIWDTFTLRDDDVILSTPPKCGTTWSQAILMMLIHGKAETDRPIWRDSIWLDCGFRDQQVGKAALDAQTHRRCIKSHTPFDGIPYDPKVTYITVYRHPIDVHFSLEKHVNNMNSDVLDFLFPDTPGAAFDHFLTAPETSQGTDDTTLASVLYHYHSFRQWSHLPNVHFFHYADLKSDIHAQIHRYAAALALEPTEELVKDIIKASGFSSMKEITRTKKRPKGEGAFADETKFFDSASSNKWIGRLTEAEIEKYRMRIEEMARTEDINWLENGSLTAT